MTAKQEHRIIAEISKHYYETILFDHPDTNTIAHLH